MKAPGFQDCDGGESGLFRLCGVIGGAARLMLNFNLAAAKVRPGSE